MKHRVASLLVILFVAACGGSDDGAAGLPPTQIPPTTADVLAAGLAGLTLSDFYKVAPELLSVISPTNWQGHSFSFDVEA